MPKETEHDKIHVSVAWGNNIPKPFHHIIAIFSVFLGLQRDIYQKTLKAKDIVLVLESMWTDNLTLNELEKRLMLDFIKQHQTVIMSERVKLQVCESTETSSIISPTFIHYKKEGGLKLPTDLSARVFEYLLDFECIKRSLFDTDHFFFQPEFQHDHEKYRFGRWDTLDPRTCEDLFQLDQCYNMVESKKCHLCENLTSRYVTDITRELPRLNDFVLCTPCQVKIKVQIFFLIFKTCRNIRCFSSNLNFNKILHLFETDII